MDWINFSFGEEHHDYEIKHIDNYLHVGRHKCDMICFHFDGDHMYHTDDFSKINIAKLFPFKQLSFSENSRNHFPQYICINDAHI